MPPLHRLSPHYHLYEALRHHIQIPCTSAGQRGPFCSDKRERGNTWAQRGEGALSHTSGALAAIQRGLNPRTDFCLQPSCFLPWSAPTWVSITPHPIKANSNGGTMLQPSLSPAYRRGCVLWASPYLSLGLLSPTGSQGPMHLARTPFPTPQASRPCRSLRSRARSCLKKPRLGMMPRWSLTFLMASTRVRWWYSMR